MHTCQSFLEIFGALGLVLDYIAITKIGLYEYWYIRTISVIYSIGVSLIKNWSVFCACDNGRTRPLFGNTLYHVCMTTWGRFVKLVITKRPEVVVFYNTIKTNTKRQLTKEHESLQKWLREEENKTVQPRIDETLESLNEYFWTVIIRKPVVSE